MARAKHSKRRSGGRQEGINFVITLVTVSVVFIFFGYLLGQYAVRVLRDEGVTTINRVQQQDVVSREIPQTVPDPPAPIPPSTTAIQGENGGSPSSSPTDNADTAAAPPATVTPPPQAETSPAPVAPAAEPTSTDQGEIRYRVQVGAFSQIANAERIHDALIEAGFSAMITDGPLYRVQSGAFTNRENAQSHAETLRGAGFEAVINQQ